MELPLLNTHRPGAHNRALGALLEGPGPGLLLAFSLPLKTHQTFLYRENSFLSSSNDDRRQNREYLTQVTHREFPQRPLGAAEGDRDDSSLTGANGKSEFLPEQFPGGSGAAHGVQGASTSETHIFIHSEIEPCLASLAC